jgi:hypothetical protein
LLHRFNKYTRTDMSLAVSLNASCYIWLRNFHCSLLVNLHFPTTPTFSFHTHPSYSTKCCFSGLMANDENGTKISRTEPHRFLYFIRSNSYFCVRLYCFRFRISNVKVENGLDIFRPFSTVFYFSTFNSEYPEFKIQFKPNFVVNHYCPGN